MSTCRIGQPVSSAPGRTARPARGTPGCVPRAQVAAPPTSRDHALSPGLARVRRTARSTCRTTRDERDRHLRGGDGAVVGDQPRHDRLLAAGWRDARGRRGRWRPRRRRARRCASGTGPNQPCRHDLVAVARPRPRRRGSRARRPARRPWRRAGCAGSGPAARRRRPRTPARRRGSASMSNRRSRRHVELAVVGGDQQRGVGRQAVRAPGRAAGRRRRRPRATAASRRRRRGRSGPGPGSSRRTARAGRRRASAGQHRPRRARRRRTPGGTRRPGWRAWSGRCAANSGRLTTSTVRPGRVRRARTGSAPAARSRGPGRRRQWMWLSTVSVPGIVDAEAEHAVRAGATPVPSVTRLVGVVDGKPVVITRRAARAARSARVGASGAAVGSWCQPRPSTSRTAIRRTPASRRSPRGRGSPARRGAASALGSTSARLAAPYRGTTWSNSLIPDRRGGGRAGAAGRRCPGTASGPAAASSSVEQRLAGRRRRRRPGTRSATTRTPWMLLDREPGAAQQRGGAVGVVPAAQRVAAARRGRRGRRAARRRRRGGRRWPGPARRRRGWRRARDAAPPGRSAAARAATTPAGSSTTSSTAWQSTRSTLPGGDQVGQRVAVALHGADPVATPASAARRVSAASASGLASTTVTRWPASASGTAKPPVPPPTSRTVRPPARRRGRARGAAPARRPRCGGRDGPLFAPRAEPNGRVPGRRGVPIRVGWNPRRGSLQFRCPAAPFVGWWFQ